MIDPLSELREMNTPGDLQDREGMQRLEELAKDLGDIVLLICPFLQQSLLSGGGREW